MADQESMQDLLKQLQSQAVDNPSLAGVVAKLEAQIAMMSIVGSPTPSGSSEASNQQPAQEQKPSALMTLMNSNNNNSAGIAGPSNDPNIADPTNMHRSNSSMSNVPIPPAVQKIRDAQKAAAAKYASLAGSPSSSPAVEDTSGSPKTTSSTPPGGLKTKRSQESLQHVDHLLSQLNRAQENLRQGSVSSTLSSPLLTPVSISSQMQPTGSNLVAPQRKISREPTSVSIHSRTQAQASPSLSSLWGNLAPAPTVASDSPPPDEHGTPSMHSSYNPPVVPPNTLVTSHNPGNLARSNSSALESIFTQDLLSQSSHGNFPPNRPKPTLEQLMLDENVQWGYMDRQDVKTKQWLQHLAVLDRGSLCLHLFTVPPQGTNDTPVATLWDLGTGTQIRSDENHVSVVTDESGEQWILKGVSMKGLGNIEYDEPAKRWGSALVESIIEGRARSRVADQNATALANIPTGTAGAMLAAQRQLAQMQAQQATSPQPPPPSLPPLPPVPQYAMNSLPNQQPYSPPMTHQQLTHQQLQSAIPPSQQFSQPQQQQAFAHGMSPLAQVMNTRVVPGSTPGAPVTIYAPNPALQQQPTTQTPTNLMGSGMMTTSPDATSIHPSIAYAATGMPHQHQHHHQQQQQRTGSEVSGHSWSYHSNNNGTITAIPMTGIPTQQPPAYPGLPGGPATLTTNTTSITATGQIRVPPPTPAGMYVQTANGVMSGDVYAQYAATLEDQRREAARLIQQQVLQEQMLRAEVGLEAARQQYAMEYQQQQQLQNAQYHQHYMGSSSASSVGGSSQEMVVTVGNVSSDRTSMYDASSTHSGGEKKGWFGHSNTVKKPPKEKKGKDPDTKTVANNLGSMGF